MSLFGRLFGSKKRTAREWYDLGTGLAGQGKLAETHEAMKNALASDPDHAELAIQIGLVLEKLNDLENAIGAFRRAAALDPRSAQAQNQLGMLLLKHGRPGDALKPLKDALRLSDYSYEACLRYAQALERTNDLEEALSHYHVAVEAAPEIG